MFITEAQLFELKYRLNSKYNGMPLSQIFLEELIRFNTGTSANHRLPLLDAIKPYYHRYVAKNDYFDKSIHVWFPDNSICVIYLNDENEWKGCHILENAIIKHTFEYERKD